MKRNYQKELEQLLEKMKEYEAAPTLFLHSCCAPCSSYVLEYLSQYFWITVFYYNPNIYPEEEYYKRVEEQKQFIKRFNENNRNAFSPQQEPKEKVVQRIFHEISFVEGNYDKDRFYEMAKGLEQVPEGGERCFGCYELRLREAAEYAKELGMDYFTTTLSISPLKNAEKLNEIGEKLAQEYGISYLTSDFKKKNGYKRSTEISREYGMYRQDYCGCVFSLREREQQKQERQKQEQEQQKQEREIVESEYRVLQIVEPDFGCEGRPEGQKPIDMVYLENVRNKEHIIIKVPDDILYQEEIEEGTVITEKMMQQIQQIQ